MSQVSSVLPEVTAASSKQSHWSKNPTEYSQHDTLYNKQKIRQEEKKERELKEEANSQGQCRNGDICYHAARDSGSPSCQPKGMTAPQHGNGEN